MIVILSIMCIVPKYHCLLYDCNIIHSEVIISSHHLNFRGAPAFMFFFTKGGKRDITLPWLHHAHYKPIESFSIILSTFSSL